MFRSTLLSRARMQSGLKWVLTGAFACGLIGLLPDSQAASEADADWVALDYASGWGPCPADRVCFNRWHFDRAARTVQRTGARGPALRRLSFQEAAELDKLVAQARQAASTCPPPPTDVFDDLTIVYRDRAAFSRPVTGCAYAQPPHPIKALKAWLSEDRP